MDAGSILGPYKLIHRLSATPISEAWQAINEDSGETCFLKVSRPDSPLGDSVAGQLLYQSVQFQERLSTSCIITARRSSYAGGLMLVEYPFLDQSVWSPVTPEHFWRHYPQSLVEIFTAIDCLHAQDLVHCDLKLSNFLVRVTPGGRPVIRLVDLDFLTSAGAPTEHRVVGTPQHIAPEIIAGESILIHSDNYSVGVFLQRCLQDFDSLPDDTTAPGAAYHTGLTRLVENLIQEVPGDRPSNLLSAARQYQCISEANADRADKRLFTIVVLSRYDLARHRLQADEGSFVRFVRDNRILGVPAGVLEDLGNALQTHPQLLARQIRALISDSAVRRLADSWRVQAPDKTMIAVYERLTQAGAVDIPGFDSPVREVSDIAPILHQARALQADGQTYHAYLLLRRLRISELWSRSELLSPEIRADVLEALVDLALWLTRSADAREHLRELLALLDRKTERHAGHFITYIRVMVITQERAAARQQLQDYLDSFPPQLDQAWRLDFERLRAWIDAALGKPEEAEREFHRLLAEAEQAGELELQMKLHSGLGTLHFRRGEGREARRQYLTALRFARRSGSEYGKYLALINLSMIAHHDGRYRKAVRYGERALTMKTTALGAVHYYSVLSTLQNAYFRLGDMVRARQYLDCIFDALSARGNTQALHTYYGNSAWMLVETGRIREAERTSPISRELSEMASDYHGVTCDLGRLAEIALHRGNRRLVSHYADLVKATGESINNHTLALEMQSARFVDRMLYDEVPDWDAELEYMRQLVETGSRVEAAMHLLYVLALAPRPVAAQAIELVRPIQRQIDAGESPAYKAAKLCQPLATVSEDRLHEIIPDLKTAYQIIARHGRRLLALVLCRRIGLIYFRLADIRLAYKFLLQARQMAEGLGNTLLLEKLQTEINEVADHELFAGRRLDAVLRVSEILKRITDRDEALREVVRFAAVETGAERGVLLLRQSDASAFRVKTSLNCDFATLRDITDFSRSIPQHVAQMEDALVIENAVEDERTREYKSIIAHNIRSVMCVPVWSGDQLTGALYLDHHTIPALFDESDFTFVRALSNFLSVILETVQTVHTAGVTTRQLTEDLHKSGVTTDLITQSPKMLAIVDELKRVARTTAPVLIQGESGTGKELLCELVHRLSQRANRPLRKLNCSAFSLSLLESELFGVAPRAVTGVDGRSGHFEDADGGTLMLDEIGDMPLEMQARLLRILQSGEFHRVGSTRTIYTDVRIVCATNRNLNRMVDDRQFRHDLLMRINTFLIEVPPLRDRREDILPLLEHFVNAYAPRRNQQPRFSEVIIDLLLKYDWPGNVRELGNVIERCCILRPGQSVTVADLPPSLQSLSGSSGSSSDRPPVSEPARMQAALDKHNGNISRAARETGIPLTTFRRKMTKYGIRRSR
ncbi:GAF domain-containing protein [candidate division GN15 bacterium]|nr:GAF domain-containing protein [candidate division GN15 bacterium]